MGSVELSERGTKESRLTDKERIFCCEYLVDYNGKRAAIAAKYSKKSAHSMAWKLLQKPKIQRYLGKAQKQQIERLEVDSDEILTHLVCCATRDPGDAFYENGELIENVHDLPARHRLAIDRIDQKKTYDKEGNLVDTHTTYQYSPKMVAVRIAMEHKGLFAPQQIENIMVFDWAKMHESTVEVDDPIEEKIQKVLEHKGEE